MPKVKVPKRLKELADELLLDPGDHVDEPEELDAIIDWMKAENNEQRIEENDRRDEIDRELNALAIKLLEAGNGRK